MGSVASLSRWASAHSLWYYSVCTGCCADEVLNARGCLYDLERFGCLRQEDPSQADLLFVNGVITKKISSDILGIYEAMKEPKYVIAIGACVSSGGPFQVAKDKGEIVLVNDLMPVDVFVPGCPPRPEAIMDGVLKLQEKIRSA